MQYELLPARSEENSLFFRMSGEAAERHGAIGCLRIDYNTTGSEFQSSWYDYLPHLKTPDFKHEFGSVLKFLRDDGEKPSFSNRANMEVFCFEIFDTWGGGASIRTPNYSYYIRFQPRTADAVYCFAYDNHYLLPELAGQHELPDFCYSTTPSSGDIVVVKNGERGFYACESTTNDELYNREFVNDRNIKLGVTRAQEEAMVAGSMFGWDSPAAKPWHYDKDGNPRPPQPKNKEQER